MPMYSVKTQKDTERVISQAKDHFHAGLGLSVAAEDRCCIRFEGGGGHVEVSVVEGEGSDAEVIVETREWDYHVKQFLKQI